MALKTVAFCAVTALCCVITMGARFAHAGLTAGASLSVSERYTNNLYLSRTDPIGDLSTTVAPRVDLRFDERAISGGVRYQATGVWYRQRRDQNRWSQLGEADAALTALGRAVRGLDVRLSGSYSRAGELPGALLGSQSPVTADGVRLPPTDTTQRGGAVAVGYPWSERFESRLAYGYSATQYDAFDLVGLADVVAGTPALAVQTHDSAVHSASLALRYRYSLLTTLTLSPGWSATRVDPVPGVSSVETDTRTVSSLTAGVDYSASPSVTLGGRVGAMVVEDDQTRLTANATVQRAWKRGLLGLAYRQGAGTGGGVTNTVSVTQGVTADGSMSLGAKTAANVRFSYARNVSIPDQPSDPTLRVATYEAGAGVSRELVRWLIGRLDYSYLTQRAQGIALDAQRHLVTVSLTAQAPPWPLLR
jgi:hypothetical protein